jgi:hypothetical protein
MREERLKPGLEFVLPSQRGAHGSPPTEMPQPKKPSVTKRFPAPAKVVLNKVALLRLLSLQFSGPWLIIGP